MKDNLERFIADNAEAFNQLSPSDDVWQAIDKQLQPKRRRVYTAHYLAAASVLLIAVAFVWFFRHSDVPQIIISDNAEIKQAEAFYVSEVETKQAELQPFGSEYPAMFKDFESEMDTLHVMYHQLETEYKNSNGNEAVQQALIQNLQMQVQLLNKQVQIITQLTQKGNKKNTKTNLM